MLKKAKFLSLLLLVAGLMFTIACGGGGGTTDGGSDDGGSSRTIYNLKIRYEASGEYSPTTCKSNLLQYCDDTTWGGTDEIIKEDITADPQSPWFTEFNITIDTQNADVIKRDFLANVYFSCSEAAPVNLYDYYISTYTVKVIVEDLDTGRKYEKTDSDYALFAGADITLYVLNDLMGIPPVLGGGTGGDAGGDTGGGTGTGTTDIDAVALDVAALAITYSSGDSATSVTKNLTLPTSGSNGTTITWATSNSAVIATDGTVTLPRAYPPGTVTVTLTSTISKNSTSVTKTFNLTVKQTPIGLTGPGGGLIFYDKGSYSTDCNGNWRYMEISQIDLGPSIWSNIDSTLIGTTSSEIGTGKTNTAAIINQSGHTDSAALICVNYRGGGRSDWFLPSKEELHQAYLNLDKPGIVDFTSSYYWCSTESSSGISAPHVCFYIDGFGGGMKYISKPVRAVRVF